MDCGHMTNTDRQTVTDRNKIISEGVYRINYAADFAWSHYGSQGKPIPTSQANDLQNKYRNGQSVLRVDYLACLSQNGVNDLRRACCRAYQVWYGLDPSTWHDAWSVLWPGVPLYDMSTADMAKATKRAANVAQVEADLKAVNVLVRGSENALERQDIAWAKRYLDSVSMILIDKGSTKYVHAAMVGAALPDGVKAERFAALQQAAKALYAQLPLLGALSRKTLPVSTVPPVVTITPSDTVPVEPGLVERTTAWVKEHPVLSLSVVAGTGYLAWSYFGRKGR